jgi:hypothetical protein
MAIDLGTSMVKGLYNKSTHWMGPKVAAPLPPADNMPWGAVPQANPAYIDPRVAPNTAGFPPPRGPSLPPQGAHTPQLAPMPPMQQTPLLAPQAAPSSPSPSLQRRAAIGAPRKAPKEMPPDARPTAKGSSAEGAGDALLRMMHGERRGGGGTV